MYQKWLQGEAVGDGRKLQVVNEAQIVREKIRKSAVSSKERPRVIIQACSSNISGEACVQIQSYDDARRTMQRQKNEILTRNTTRNKNISEIDTNEEYKKTDRGECFYCTILVIITTIESSCLAQQEILHC
jgi:hypothetical protein